MVTAILYIVVEVGFFAGSIIWPNRFGSIIWPTRPNYASSHTGARSRSFSLRLQDGLEQIAGFDDGDADDTDEIANKLWLDLGAAGGMKTAGGRSFSAIVCPGLVRNATRILEGIL